ncbi:TPA: pentapeptide repeat-containing protein [Citrobacter werkmanii]
MIIPKSITPPGVRSSISSGSNYMKLHDKVEAIFSGDDPNYPDSSHYHYDQERSELAMEVGKAWQEFKTLNPKPEGIKGNIVLEFKYQNYDVHIERSGGCFYTSVTQGEHRIKYEDYSGIAGSFLERCDIAQQYNDIKTQNPSLNIDFNLMAHSNQLDLYKADLKNANLSHLNLKNILFSEADMSGANLSHADLEEADMSNVNLQDANMSNVNLKDADMRDANLKGANLRESTIEGADFENACLVGTDFRQTDLSLIERNSDDGEQWKPALMEPNMRLLFAEATPST